MRLTPIILITITSCVTLAPSHHRQQSESLRAEGTRAAVHARISANLARTVGPGAILYSNAATGRVIARGWIECRQLSELQTAMGNRNVVHFDLDLKISGGRVRADYLDIRYLVHGRNGRYLHGPETAADAVRIYRMCLRGIARRLTR